MSTIKVHPSSTNDENGIPFQTQPIPTPFSAPTESDLLLGLQALGLSSLAYNSHPLTVNKLSEAIAEKRWFSFLWPLTKDEVTRIDKVATEIENDCMHTAKVGRDDFRAWNESFKIKHKKLRKRLLASQCFTGVVDLSTSPEEGPNLVPFIAFRGTVSTVDWIRDSMAVLATEYVTDKGTKAKGKVGLGFAEMLNHLKQIKHDGRNIVEELLHLIAKYDNGFLITGHSLAGGCCNVFFLEFLLDYPDLVQKYQSKGRIVTFGAPRAIELPLSDAINATPITYLRFVNNLDLVTTLSITQFKLFFHPGKAFYPYIANDTKALTDKRDPAIVLPDWKTIVAKKQDSAVLWLLVYDPSNPATEKYDNFSAEPMKDQGIKYRINMIQSFSGKYYKTHDLIDHLGYDQMFANVLNVQNVSPELQRIGQLAKQFRAGEIKHIELIKKEFNIDMSL